MGESTEIQGPVVDHPRDRSFLETNNLGVPHFGRSHNRVVLTRQLKGPIWRKR